MTEILAAVWAVAAELWQGWLAWAARGEERKCGGES